ncbi:MAG TPA: DNA-binding response regulator [Firmicutes bacterium]|jgi:two-component system, response regulator YesN|nr:DNA-binding response regulator [Bacillota bacterium]
MYKVFLVEDEIVVRDGIRDDTKWEETDFIFCGEAPDGEIALPLIQEMKPDILITDIKMPFMDGLQLSRVVKKNMPWIKIIILSGHDEFDFAKEAISIGVAEYLLKPISSVNLLNVLKKMTSQIETEKKERENIEKLSIQLENNKNLLKEKFLNELSQGIVSPVETIEKAKYFGINIISKFYTVLVIEPEFPPELSSSGEYLERLKIEALISGITDQNPDIIKFKRNLAQTVLILKGDNMQTLEENAYAMAQSIKYEVERNSSCMLTIGIGEAKERLQGISQSLAEADSATQFVHVFGTNKIIGISDIIKGGFKDNKLLDYDHNKINDFFKFGNTDNTGELILELMKCVKEYRDSIPLYFYYIFLDIIFAASKFINELGGNIEEVIPEALSLEELISHIRSSSERIGYLEIIFKKVLEYRDTKKEDKYGDIIHNAKTHIANNYACHEISLNSVASSVNVSPSHFSTIFSQETGSTFIEYLTDVRIEKAKELLKSSSLKTSEITFKVGYNDPQYFSYVFKKRTGMTPKEFRG